MGVYCISLTPSWNSAMPIICKYMGRQSCQLCTVYLLCGLVGYHLRSWDQNLINWNLLPFYVVYDYNPHDPLDLALIHDLKWVNAKAQRI